MGRRHDHFAANMRGLAIGLGLGIAFAAFSNHAAWASESQLLPNPTGGTDINQATLPPTGLYGFVAGVPLNASTSYNDQFGNTSKAQQFSNPTILGGLSFVYPWQVLGGQVASSIVLQEHASCLTLNNTIHNCYSGGLGDTYSDLVYWTRNIGLFGVTPGNNPYLKYGMNIGVGLAAKIPTGPYSATEPAGVSAGGNNLFVWVPDVAFTYNTGPNWSFFDSTQVSARFFYAVPNINTATNYQSGQVLDIDFAITQLWGHWRFGLVGSYSSQLTDDYHNGVVVPAFTSASFGSYGLGKKWESLWLGPMFGYTWDNGIQFKAKYAQIVLNRAQVNENVFSFAVGFPLWQPEKPQPLLTK
jgi:hypothetical protein